MKRLVDAPRRRRGWSVPLLGVASLAVVGVASLAGCNRGGGLSHSERVQLDREKAAGSLADLGVSAVKKQYPQGAAWAVDLAGADVTDKMVKQILALGQVTELHAGGSKVTDKQLETLAASTEFGLLLKLDVSNTGITDAGLRAVLPLRWLSELNVKGSQVTAEGLADFQKNRLRNPMGLKLKIER